MIQYLKMADFMKKYRVSRQTVYRWIEEGLPKSKLGNEVRFEETEAHEWIKENKMK